MGGVTRASNHAECELSANQNVQAPLFTMSFYHAQFKDFTSEHLLEKRALGDELDDEAHRAIEHILLERGEVLAPRPTAMGAQPRLPDPSRPVNWVALLTGGGAVLAALLLGLLAGAVWGVLVLAAYGAYRAYQWFSGRMLPDNGAIDAASGQELVVAVPDPADENGLTEIMHCAASGDVKRVQQLIDAGADVNARSHQGTTALMYAARNNHMVIVASLIEAGAFANARSNKGNTAGQLARQFGHLEVAAALEQCCSGGCRR